MVAALVLVGCGSPSATTSQPPLARVSPEPGARPGELAPTLGPQSSDISREGAVHLSVISALLNGTPIFSGDFADPYILRTKDVLYTFATSTVTTKFAKAADIPVIALTAGSDFTGHYLGTRCRRCRSGP
jgi:hypothetical protein